MHAQMHFPHLRASSGRYLVLIAAKIWLLFSGGLCAFIGLSHADPSSLVHGKPLVGPAMLIYRILYSQRPVTIDRQQEIDTFLAASDSKRPSVFLS